MDRPPLIRLRAGFACATARQVSGGYGTRILKRARIMGGLLGVWLLAGLLGHPACAADIEYTVRAGDTLSGIAQREGVSADLIQRYNNLAHPDRLRVGQVLRIPPGPDAPVPYEVRRGESLSVIARRHGMTTRELAEFNKIDNPDQLRAGQIIQVPAKAALRHTPLPPDVRRTLDRIRIRPGWRVIVLHHSGVNRGNMKDMDRYHREERRMENGLAYHFVIGNGRGGMRDGEIGITHRWRRQLDGGHLRSVAQNQYSIGICLVGNFEVDRPTPRQMESLRALVQYLQTRTDIGVDAVRTHQQVNPRPTQCPGRHFPTAEFVGSL